MQRAQELRVLRAGAHCGDRAAWSDTEGVQEEIARGRMDEEDVLQDERGSYLCDGADGDRATEGAISVCEREFGSCSREHPNVQTASGDGAGVCEER